MYNTLCLKIGDTYYIYFMSDGEIILQKNHGGVVLAEGDGLLHRVAVGEGWMAISTTHFERREINEWRYGLGGVANVGCEIIPHVWMEPVEVRISVQTRGGETQVTCIGSEGLRPIRLGDLWEVKEVLKTTAEVCGIELPAGIENALTVQAVDNSLLGRLKRTIEEMGVTGSSLLQKALEIKK